MGLQTKSLKIGLDDWSIFRLENKRQQEGYNRK